MPELSFFHPAVRAWFSQTLGEPTPPQAEGWPAIAAGENVLITAPTGSGKTLAAFLQCINWLYLQAEQGVTIDDGVKILYISPLKALNNDVHRNLDLPLAGIARTAAAMGYQLPRLKTGLRTGDTPSRERRRMQQRPPHILCTTPESLFLMLCSRQRQILTAVRFVIVDEIHSLFSTKRGTHLSLSLEHLEELCGHGLQRIGLSATLRPLDKVAEFLAGGMVDDRGRWRARPVRIIDTGQRKELDLRVEVPLPELRSLPEKTIWPAIYRHLLSHIKKHRSTLIFVNNRQLAERITSQLNNLAGHNLARVHHGSLSRQVREEAETLLKEGKLRCLVATSSLELGIDVGTIDLVIQVESPHEVTRGLQRVGRAGHVVGLPSKGRIVVKTHYDLLEAAFISREMKEARVETARTPENCLDVLAQQIVGMTAVDSLSEDKLFQIVRRAAGYRSLSSRSFRKVLAMLSGQFGADEFIDLRPRIYWDRVNRMVRATEGGKRLVYTSAGTIPDRGYFAVYTAGSQVRLGELEEEFVYERRIGDRFVLGTNVWRVEEIRQDRVIVSPANGLPTVPFWKGEISGRQYELGCIFGRFLREAENRLGEADDDLAGASSVINWLQHECLIDDAGARNLSRYLQEQKQATGVLPTDRRLVIEEFRDELGEWRVVIHSVFGQKVNRPLALLLAEQLRRQQGLEVAGVETDDGIMFLCPAGPEPPSLDFSTISTTDLEEKLSELVSTTPLFGALFRQNATRALILPRRGYGQKRTPLWLSRLKAADLFQIVSKYPGFPVVMETYREILQDVFDLAGLREVITGLQTGTIQVNRCRRNRPSPFAQPLVFGLTAEYLYSPDTPKAERKLHSLALDRAILKDLLGQAELRQLLDPEVIEETAQHAAGTSKRLCPRTADELHAWLLKVGEWRLEENGVPETVGQLCGEDPAITASLRELVASGRIKLIEWGADRKRQRAWVATESLTEYLNALPRCRILPVPDVEVKKAHSTQECVDLTQELEEIQAEERPITPGERLSAIKRLLRRYAGTRSPFTAAAISERYGLPLPDVEDVLHQLAEEGVVQAGEFLPGGSGEEWCDVRLLQQMHRRSLAKARKAVQPRQPRDYAAFLARWQGLGSPASGICALTDVLEKLGGMYFPAYLWETSLLPARVKGYQPGDLDQLLASGLFQWRGRGGIEKVEIAIFPLKLGDPDSPAAGFSPHSEDPDSPVAALSLPLEDTDSMTAGFSRRLDETGSIKARIRRVLLEKGALSIPQIWQLTGISIFEILRSLREMAGTGEVTNDSFGPVRYFLASSSRSRRQPQSVGPAVLARMGRWALTFAGAEAAGEKKEETARLELVCERLLNLYGIVSREVAAAAGLVWEEISAILDRWEFTGKVRRGYFVEGLSGRQYATTAAIEGLRLSPETGLPRYLGLVVDDPANVWGNIFPWPGKRRPAGPAVIVCRAGKPVLAAEGKKVSVFTRAPLGTCELQAALEELVRVLEQMRGDSRRMELVEWDGRRITETPAGEILQQLGFERGYRGLTKW